MISKALIISEQESQQLSNNLQRLFKEHNTNVNKVAQALKLPIMTIRRLALGETTDPRVSTLKLVGDYFGVPIDFLISSNPKTSFQPLQKNKPHFVPILNWETAEKINTVHDLELNKWKEWQPVPLSQQKTVSANAFALESRPSMHPKFPPGTIFIIDPDCIPTDGDMVLVRVNRKELTLRELVIDPPEWKLQPVVTGSSILKYTPKEHKIVGVNILTLLFNRRN